jgi:hypothetical protein
MAKTIVINNYKKYWVSDTAQGHLIKICHGNNDQVIELDLRWEDRKRDKGGRPIKSQKDVTLSHQK